MPEVSRRSSTGLIVAAMLGISAASVMLASFQYVLVEMQTEFTFSTDSANALAFMPSAASLMVVFIAGALADRWGPRRLFIASIVLFISGGALVAVAPGLPMVIVGRLLDGVGGVTMAIVALAIVNSSVTEPGTRARVFGIYAAVTPATFMLAPVGAALIVQTGGWRMGMLPGILFGLGALIMAVRYIPARPPQPSGELLTPLLAGLVLTGVALGVTSIPTSVALAAVVASIGLVSLIVLIVLLRRMSSPSLNLGWCKGRGMLILLFALCFTAMPNLFFYTNLLLQYRYQVPLLVMAVLLMIPQASAVGGGLLSGPISARVGPTIAATGALFVSAIASLSTLFVTASAPIWVPVLALAVSAAPFSFVVGPMTNTMMSSGPADGSGVTSSMRKATWTLGNVLGGAIVGAIAFSAFQAKLTSILSDTGLTSAQAQTIAREIRDGAVVDEIAPRISDPIAQASLMSKGAGLLEAQSYAFAVMGVLTSIMYLIAGVLMIFYMRRTRTTLALDKSRSISQ